MDKIKLLGLSTISFYADEHEKTKKWYSEILGMKPYFNVPGYSEFRLGDYQHELGIIDSKYDPKNTTELYHGYDFQKVPYLNKFYLIPNLMYNNILDWG